MIVVYIFSNNPSSIIVYMSCWERVIVGTFISVVGCCCDLTKMIRGRGEPVMVEVPYMEDRIGRQRQDLAQIWPRDGNIRLHDGMSSMGRRRAGSHADL